MHLAILRSGFLLAIPVLGAPGATVQTEFPFAAGTDRAGRAQAVSNAAGRVLIESPEFPRGLWVDVLDVAGHALPGIQVAYEGRPDSLVALRCVDPSGQLQETLLWTRLEGNPLSLSLKSGEPADLPAGMAPIDWRIDRSVEALLESSRLVGWTAVEALLRKRRPDQARYVVKLDDDAAVVHLDHANVMERLVAYLQQTHQPLTSGLADPPHFGVLLGQRSDSFFGSGVILYSPLFEDARLESILGDHYLNRSSGRLTQEIASWTSLYASGSGIRSLVGLEHMVRLYQLELSDNEIVDVGPLASLTRLEELRLDETGSST